MNDNYGKDICIRKTTRIQWILVVITLLIYILFYIPVPYFVTTPGSALDLSALVEVDEGYEEQGRFMLTTISMRQANVSFFILAKIASYMDTIPEELIIGEDEESEDYTNRQFKVMEQSKENAIIAAFTQLDYPIDIKQTGVLVMDIVPGLPSEEVLKVGDLIVSIDNQELKQSKQIIDYFQNKVAGDVVKVSFIRNGKSFSEEITVVNLLDSEERTDANIKRVGIGFYPADEREVIPSKDVTFHTENIGGPSAGLMFTLEIINQLIPEDLTKGYKIAGTGTITPDGVVGQIGGARLKVKAAYKQGTEIFFVPKDIAGGDINQKEAEISNYDLGNPMEIVPVATLDEAVQFLKTLSQK